ncbi:MAG: protein phosphatase 2C domain-containing protein [Oscillospiraceae bacterium]|nr:protein phosphatase 2C domain-containing protein [Oscillospiraceae bacterium]
MGLLDKLLGKTKKPSRSGKVKRYERKLGYRTGNMQGIGSRKRQEDSFAFVNALDVVKIRDMGLMALLADGMGGLEGGKEASEAACAAVSADFEKIDRDGDIAAQLKESVLSASDSVFTGFEGRSGSTMIACVLYDEKLYFVSVGDSYLYLKRGNSLCRLNRDQNYRWDLYLESVRDGVVWPEDADDDPNAHRLTEFIGKNEVSCVDMLLAPLPLLDGDMLLLCSDGVGGVLSETELMACMDGHSPQEACDMIGAEIKKKNVLHQDNYTALVISCGY